MISRGLSQSVPELVEGPEPATGPESDIAASDHSDPSTSSGTGITGFRSLQELWLLPRNAAIAFMLLYRRLISPLYGEVCRYYPSCSRYALEVFQRQGFTLGVLFTVWRLLRCNPFSPGGVDDAPEREHPSFSINARGFVRPNTRKA